MDIKVITANPRKLVTEALVLPYYEGAEKPDRETARADKALHGAISDLAGKGEIKGKLNEITIVHTLGRLPAARVVVVGLGKTADLTVNKVRGAVGETCRFLRNKGITSIAMTALGSGVNKITSEKAGQAIAEGAILGLYTFRKHMTRAESKPGEIKELTIIATERTKDALEAGMSRGRITAEAANRSRDMVNEPSNIKTPTLLAEIATELAKKNGLEITVLNREQMAEMGMGGLLAVAQGSRQPPKFIVLNYRGGGASGIDLALVGKGITFDSGGISIKPSEKMEEMKGDMAGGAAVINAISAIAQLKVKLNVMAVIPATENLPDGNAYRPGDVLKAMNGKTMEVISTDAEGRLILADALSYARKQGAKQIVDVATLTGACRVALGDICTGAFTNKQELVDKVIAAGKEAGERIWQMPMFEEYREQNKSDIADMKNTGGRWGGAITAAKFLEEFAEDTPWVHLDIAGTDMSAKDQGYMVKGGTGVPVRTLIELAIALQK